ncbi:hypothetical protein AB0K93_13305 [Streptomyces sp. NPDC052676]|uniref:hypothetical protein n=1 Tax=Streptomyces sp. NPDC052676 TaxID=3154953 RepID=UPI00342F10F9
MPLLRALATEAAGGAEHHLAAVQLPVSLVMMAPLKQALDGKGSIRAAADIGLQVMASAPLHGGELPAMVDQELADLIRPGLTRAQACILAAASCPGVTHVLLTASVRHTGRRPPTRSPSPPWTPPSCGRSRSRGDQAGDPARVGQALVWWQRY